MKNDDYSGEPIIKNSWPEWRLLEGGGAERRWTFEFEDDVSSDAISLEVPEMQDLQVSIRGGASARELSVIVTTYANPSTDEVYFVASYRLFQWLEERFGRLKYVQGQPRNHWRPFRACSFQ